MILAGLYLSKFDSEGLKSLGFDNFVEAFNVIAYGLGARPASVKNYRDEFDPYFPNARRGWHKRPTRQYCLEILEKYQNLGLEEFTSLVQSLFGIDLMPPEIERTEGGEPRASGFAQRLATGVAAEQYFASIHRQISTFSGFQLEDTTRYGCGYDFRLRPESSASDFLAVEVKGLTGQTGSVSLTPKEYEAASDLRDRFFLFVVRNFRETPTHSIYRDPLDTTLQFKRTERVIVQVSWLTSL